MVNTTSLTKARQVVENIENELQNFPDFDERWVKDKKYNIFLSLLQSVIEGFSWVTEDIKNEHLIKENKKVKTKFNALKSEKENLELENSELKNRANELDKTVSNYKSFIKYSGSINELQQKFEDSGISIQLNTDKKIAENFQSYDNKLKDKIYEASVLIKEIEEILKDKIIKSAKLYEDINKRRDEDVG